MLWRARNGPNGLFRGMVSCCQRKAPKCCKNGTHKDSNEYCTMCSVDKDSLTQRCYAFDANSTHGLPRKAAKLDALLKPSSERRERGKTSRVQPSRKISTRCTPANSGCLVCIWTRMFRLYRPYIRRSDGCDYFNLLQRPHR